MKRNCRHADSKERMKPICCAVIDPSGNLYGSELCLLDILYGIDFGRFKSVVYLPQGAHFSAALHNAGIEHHELLLSQGVQQTRQRKLTSYIALAVCLARQKPDLLYVNEAGIIRPMLMIARLLRRPVLCQVQTLEDARWVSSLKPTSKRIAYVCNSQFIAEQTRVPKSQCSTVYYGYRPKGLKRARPMVITDKQTFVCGILGRIGGSKGHDLVLEAADMLKCHGRCEMEFRFIGEAPTPEESRQWRRQVQERGLDHMIEFRGYRSNIAAELTELDLLLIPSTAEPFGRILCEAAEAEVPVLLSDSGGLGELSHRFDVGIRHEARNAADLVDKLLWIQANYDQVCRNFSEGAKRLLSALDYDAYIRVIQDILVRVADGETVAMEWKGL